MMTYNLLYVKLDEIYFIDFTVDIITLIIIFLLKYLLLDFKVFRSELSTYDKYKLIHNELM